MEFISKFFKLKENKTTFGAEIIAGFTTFVTMAYILAINPEILGAAFEGVPNARGAIFTATALSAFIATMCMALIANRPFALAAGMGVNTLFAFTIAPKFGWRLALIAVFIEGVLFVFLSLFKLRDKLLDCIPRNLKYAISVGIGLFICFIGLQQAGIVVSSPGTVVGLGDIKAVPALLTLFGVIVILVLRMKNFKGALLWGILITYALGLGFQMIGLKEISELVPDGLLPTVDGKFALVSLPPSIKDINIAAAFQGADFHIADFWGFVIVIFSLLFIDVFGMVGTVVGISEMAGFLDSNGRLPGRRNVVLVDSVSTVVGASAGTSTVVIYAESAVGVVAGGRTGLTSMVTALLFFLSLIFSPIILSVPSFAAAPALIVIGLFMIESIAKIKFADYTEGFPAFICMIMMPLTYDISNGLIFGILSYIALKLATGRYKELNPTICVVGLLFLLKIIFA